MPRLSLPLLTLGMLLAIHSALASLGKTNLPPPTNFGSLLQVSQATAVNTTAWTSILDSQANPNITFDATAGTIIASGSGTQIAIGQTLLSSGLSSLEFSFDISNNVLCFGVVESHDNVTIDNIFLYPDTVNMICTNNTQYDLFPIIPNVTQVGQTYQMVVDREFLQINFLTVGGDGFWVGNFLDESACYIVIVFEEAGTLIVNNVDVIPQVVVEEEAEIADGVAILPIFDGEGVAFSSEEASFGFIATLSGFENSKAQSMPLDRGTIQKYVPFV